MIKCRYLNDDGEFRPRTRCGIAAAVLGGAALSAGASYLGSSNAADAQAAAAAQAAAVQREMFAQAKEQLLPFINMGKGNIDELVNWFNPNADSGSPLAALMKLVMPGADMSETLAQTPGYQFTESRGLKAVENALAKRGLAGSGGAVSKGAADFVTGLANNTWQSVVNALQGGVQTGGNALANIVNMGQGAAGSLAGNAISTGTGLANSAIQQGNAQAAGYLGQANAIGGLGNSLSQLGIINSLTGGNMFGNIFGGSGGSGYTPNYVGSNGVYGPGF